MVLRILLVLFILFAGMRTAAQSTNDFPDYPGGMDSLTKSLLKQMDGILTSIDREYFMFFTISVQADGVITVNELFRKQDSTSRIVLDMIQKTAPRWKKLSPAAKPIILPLFFTADKAADPGREMLQHIVTSRDYERHAKPMEGLLLPPIVVTFFDSH